MLKKQHKIYPRRAIRSILVTPKGVVTPADIARCHALTITDIDEWLMGECIYSSPDTDCVATSTYEVIYHNEDNLNGPTTFLWSIVSGNVSFLSDGSGGYDNTSQMVNVRSSSGADEEFELECTVTDGAGETSSFSKVFIHLHSQV